MSAGPIIGGLVFLYLGYFMTYVTAFIILGIDIALRLLLILKGPQLTPSEKVKGKKLYKTLYFLTTCQMWTAIWGSFQSAFICGALDSVLPLFVWHIYGWNLMQAGGSFMALLGPSVLSPLVGKLIQQYGVRKSATAGYVGTSVALGCLLFVGWDGALYQTFLVILLVVAGTFNLFSEISSWIDAVAMAES
jgi:hypothetical protein